MNQSKFKYIPKNERNKKTASPEQKNEIEKYADNLIKSEFDRYYNNNLMIDYKKILDGNCIYLPNFFCQTNDLTIFNKLKKELDLEIDNNNNLIQWNKHKKYENPNFSNTFNELVKKLSVYFKFDIYQTRLNFYKDGQDFKQLHKDSHAYCNGKKENFTCGISLGSTRSLIIVHEESGNKFDFPQNNGDIFAFNNLVNDKFLHGVPKVNKIVSPRISIIAWGKKN